MGIVYLGRDERLDRSVAVKVILSDSSGSSTSASMDNQARASFAEVARELREILVGPPSRKVGVTRRGCGHGAMPGADRGVQILGLLEPGDKCVLQVGLWGARIVPLAVTWAFRRPVRIR